VDANDLYDFMVIDAPQSDASKSSLFPPVLHAVHQSLAASRPTSVSSMMCMLPAVCAQQ